MPTALVVLNEHFPFLKKININTAKPLKISVPSKALSSTFPIPPVGFETMCGEIPGKITDTLLQTAKACRDLGEKHQFEEINTGNVIIVSKSALSRGSQSLGSSVGLYWELLPGSRASGRRPRMFF